MCSALHAAASLLSATLIVSTFNARVAIWTLSDTHAVLRLRFGTGTGVGGRHSILLGLCDGSLPSTGVTAAAVLASAQTLWPRAFLTQFCAASYDVSTYKARTITNFILV